MFSLDVSWPWLVLLGLGAVHGINPAMGWLFAVALGLQERKGRAVWRALPPLALGHFLAIGGAIGLAALLGLVVPLSALKWFVAATLLCYGVFLLVSNRHPQFGGMRVGVRDLTIWSFLMASAHGAGLMVVPFILGSAAAQPRVTSASVAESAPMAAVYSIEDAPIQTAAAHAGHSAALVADEANNGLTGLMATLVHTVGYLLVTGLVAVIVYEKVGLRLLRSAWINIDLIWAGTLILTGLITPLI